MWFYSPAVKSQRLRDTRLSCFFLPYHISTVNVKPLFEESQVNFFRKDIKTAIQNVTSNCINFIINAGMHRGQPGTSASKTHITMHTHNPFVCQICCCTVQVGEETGDDTTQSSLEKNAGGIFKKSRKPRGNSSPTFLKLRVPFQQ